MRAAYGPGASPKRLFSQHRVRPPAGTLASSAIWRSGSLSRPGLSVLARKLGVSIPPVSNGTDVPNSAWHGVGLPESGLPLCAHSVPAPGCFPLGASVPVASLPGQKPSLWSPERTRDPFLGESEVTDRLPPREAVSTSCPQPKTRTVAVMFGDWHVQAEAAPPVSP